MFETHAFCREVETLARAQNVLTGLATTFEEHHMNVYYENLINEPTLGGITSIAPDVCGGYVIMLVQPSQIDCGGKAA